MTYSRSTLSLALSTVLAGVALGEGFNLKSTIPSNGMNEVYAGRLMVKVRGADKGTGRAPDLTGPLMSRLSAKLGGARMIGGLNHGGWTIWEINESKSPHAAAALLKSDPDVICAEPMNRVYKLSLPIPNDPDWAYEETATSLVYNLGSGGFGSGSGSGSGSGGGGGGSHTGFRRLWNLWDVNAVTSDSNNVVQGGWAVYPGKWYTASTKPTDCPIIAFIDTGVDMDHPDFINAGGTGTDVSTGGQLMKAQSAYFTNGQLVAGGDPTDQDGHGTHVCGLALASGNNGSFDNDGMIGIGYNSRGIVLRVFDNTGNSTDGDAAAAMMYAADNGAAIINLSLGTTNYSQVFQDATTYAFQKGSLVVAAGNENGNGGGNLGPIYPAGCSGALGVTANAPGQYPADDYYAGYGNYVGIAAPGGDLVMFSQTNFYIQYVFSTACRYDCALSGNTTAIPPYKLDYTYLAGTSMACPQVAGAAGLYYGQNKMHQSDGFANMKAFQALQLSCDGTGGALQGGWEPTQGFGSLDINQLVQLSSNPNPRSASVGDVTGIVYYGGTPQANVTVTAKSTVAPFNTYQTTTFADGTYRFDPFPGGIYNITAIPLGSAKTKQVQVTNGCDMMGVDFFVGPTGGIDNTPPVIAFFNYLGQQTKTTMDFNQWAYDPESELDSATVEIGTEPGSSNIRAPQAILPGTTKVHLTNLKLPEHYSVTFKYTNGIGLVSEGLQDVHENFQDATVSDSSEGVDTLGTHFSVKSGGTGSNQVAYLAINLAALRPTISNVTLTLTGSAKGTGVPVGVYGTNNSPWTESNLDWHNAPTISGSAVDEQVVSTSGQYSWNITSLVQAAMKAGLKSVTVAVKCDSASASGASFASRRSAEGTPLLVSTSHD